MATEKKVKVALIGPTATGKTQLVNRLMYDKFDQKINPTVGVDFLSKSLSSEKFGEIKIKAQLWDSGGQKRFRSLLRSYTKDSAVIAIVLATTDLAGNPITQAALKTDAEKFYQVVFDDPEWKPTDIIPPIYFVINEFVDAEGRPLGPPLSQDEIKDALKDFKGVNGVPIPVLFCCVKNGKEVKETWDEILYGAYRHQVKAESTLQGASVPLPTELPKKQPRVPSSGSPFSVEKFLKFLADHKKLLIGEGILIAAAIIILVTLASLPIGGLPVLAGLSALAVAGITAGVVLLAWTLGGIIGNVLFKENGGGALSPPDKSLPRKPSPSASHDQKQTPGGKHYPSVISTSSEKTSEEELKPLPDSEEASKQQPGSSSGTPKNQ